MMYRVVWEIDIPATGPVEAAERAREIQRDPQSWATVYRVTDEEGHIRKIDFAEVDKY